MIDLVQTERSVYMARSPYMHTKRYCMFCIFEHSSRVIVVHYLKQYASVRKITCTCGPVSSERKIVIPAISESYYSHRMLLCGDRYPAAGDRWCTYVPGAQVIMATVPTCLIIRHRSDRTTICCKDPISQRFILFSVLAPSERICEVLRVQQTLVHAPEVWMSIIHTSDVFCYVETSQWITMRRVSFPLTIPNDQLCWIQRYQEAVVYGTEVEIGIRGVTSVRKCVVCITSAWDERTILLMGWRFSDRYISCSIRLFSDRLMSACVSKMCKIHHFKLIQAHLHVSDIKCMYTAIIHNTERLSIAEGREIFVTRFPRTNPDATNLYIYTDDSRQFYVSNERFVESYISNYKRKEVDSNENRTRITLAQQSLEIDGVKHSTNLEMTLVDNTGAAIWDGAPSVKKNIIGTTIFNLTISII